MIRALIVDDEPLARQEVRALLAEVAADVEVVGECDNAIEGIAAINRLRPDVVFLDIQMPRINGMEMVGMLDPDSPPTIVFLTAYDEYAVQAFEKNAFDYLLKPVDPARLTKTLERLRVGRPIQDLGHIVASQPLSRVPCSGHNRIYLLKTSDIEYACSGPSGVSVVDITGIERYTELTLRTLEERAGLFRCHRQYLVNLDRVREIQLSDAGGGVMITASSQRVPVSRRFLKGLKDRLELS